MSEEPITLSPKQHGKLGIIHCGVTREGFIAVGGNPRDISDGEEMNFEKLKIKVTRKGSEYIFTSTD